MSKIFYISLIIMLTTIIEQIRQMYMFNEFFMKQSASLLLIDFWYLELAFIICSILVSIVFFIYRFNEKIIWPLLSTILQIIYFYYVWTTAFRYYSSPVLFLTERKAIWEKGLQKIIPQIYKQYKCCGFLLNQTSNKCKEEEIPCSRAIIKKIGNNLSDFVSRDFSLSFIHVASMISIWATYFLGGIEFDQEPENKPGENYQAL
ncbi:hypothetical protein TRFO_35430 [Tritrichomonas foetus]|uniref:Tetraspanin family protein n=1 Tax=Tritrichomonas foetus TaxID=1144522 RepID=A0A1J4JLS7_9EUKA|nr:hypothetical protein TRFO_35430 [Tritrichomonas foetus]|eukprot:OHS98228.1 hypothetical protein TRFO_35430 [Tritrichomonas foetus]